MQCNFHGNSEIDLTLLAVSLCAVSGKFSSLHKSQLLFSLQRKHRPNIFCHIKDTNGQFYFLSGTNVHRRFRSCSKISDTYLSINPKQILGKKKKKKRIFLAFFSLVLFRKWKQLIKHLLFTCNITDWKTARALADVPSINGSLTNSSY